MPKKKSRNKRDLISNLFPQLSCDNLELDIYNHFAVQADNCIVLTQCLGRTTNDLDKLLARWVQVVKDAGVSRMLVGFGEPDLEGAKRALGSFSDAVVARLS